MNSSSWRLTVAPEHPALAGHFPNFPLVPGVLLLDEALQAIECEQAASAPAGTPRTCWHISSVKFHRAVLAGEPLSLHYACQPDGSTHFELRSGQTKVMSATVQRRDPSSTLAVTTS